MLRVEISAKIQAVFEERNLPFKLVPKFMQVVFEEINSSFKLVPKFMQVVFEERNSPFKSRSN